MRTLQVSLVLLMLGMIGFSVYHVLIVATPPSTELYVTLGLQAIAFLFGLHTLWVVGLENRK